VGRSTGELPGIRHVIRGMHRPWWAASLSGKLRRQVQLRSAMQAHTRFIKIRGLGEIARRIVELTAAHMRWLSGSK
jgi:predicted phosphohydrolase